MCIRDSYKSMTGMEYLKFMAGLFVADRERAKACVEYAVERCGLGERLGDKIGTYSRGMTRKLLLSRAVMTRPALEMCIRDRLIRSSEYDSMS